MVTHLAQVAAFADRQFVVLKADDGQVTTAGSGRSPATARVDGLARMDGRPDGTDASVAHAKDLLDRATKARR